MDITGLDIVQISAKLAAHAESHITGYKLPKGQSLFQENYLLHFDECRDFIPARYHHHFKAADKFNGFSGFVEAGGQQYVLMLLAGEALTTAYLLSAQSADAEGSAEAIIIADFLRP